MGLFNLFRVCIALFFISTVNIAHANYIYNAATGVWMPTSSTVLAPPNSGSTFIPATGIPPNPTVNNGGFTTTMGGSFRSSPVNGTTQRVPITLNGTVTKPNANKSAVARLTRGGLAGLTLGYGIEQLLNSVGWLIDEGGKVSKRTAPALEPNIPDCPPGYQCLATVKGLGGCAPESPPNLPYCFNGLEAETACNATDLAPCYFYENNGSFSIVSAYSAVEKWPLATTFFNPNGYTYGFYINQSVPPATTLTPVSDDEIQQAVDSSYIPHPTDYPLIVSEPTMQPTETTVQPIPRLNFPSVQTTYTDLDTGQTTVKETNIWHDYKIHNNGSSQPKIEEKKTEQQDTFKDGVKTGTSTTTSSSGVTTGGASARAPAPTVEFPPFCAWASVVCDWIGWTKEPIDDDLDLAQLINDEDFERNYSISFGDKSCPAPISINVFFLKKTVELSYEPACQLAIYAKPFVLISAYIFAIMITLGVVRNG